MGLLLIPDALIADGITKTGVGLRIEGGLIGAIGPVSAIRHQGDAEVNLPGKTLAPGLVDLQVNGGGGCLLNDDPTTGGVRTIVQTHLQAGSTTILPTLISCDHKTMVRARAAVEGALLEELPGLAGLHLEGPFLDEEKRGAHAASALRAPNEEDLELLCQKTKGTVLLTLAATYATSELCARLSASGVTLSLGHSAADAQISIDAFDRGVRLVTHLYNAMSPLAHRSPGLVGAALADKRVTVGLIADGHHVHPTALAAAWQAKGPDRFLCVSDAIDVAGTTQQESQLAGQTVRVEGGRCVNQEGRLAGSAIVLSDSLAVLVNQVGLSLPEALTACAGTPARVLGLDDRGDLRAGLRADLIALDLDLKVHEVWVAGVGQK